MGRVWDLPQSKVPYPLLELEVGGVGGYVEGMGGGEGVGTWIGM